MNEYLNAFEELQEKSTFKGQQWFGERQRLVEEYSWAIPNEDVLTYLAEFDEITEVGAGSGYWAHCIEEYGGTIDAYDIEPPSNTWTHVTPRDVWRMQTRWFNRPTLLVWPPLNEGVATKTAKRGPPHLLYVGEPRGGCTAEDEFFDVLAEKYGLVAKVDIPSYAGVNDDFYHYVRKI